jgi:hypothetical protein
MTAHNEGDIIAFSIRKLVDQGIGVYLIDNWSSDGTLEEARMFEGKGLIGHERFPASGPSPYFSLRKLLARTESLHAELGARWTVYHDVDEIRISPWPEVSYREGLERVEQMGYNCVNHIVVVFRPTNDAFVPGEDFGLFFTHFEMPARPSHFIQYKAWSTDKPVSLQQTGGHRVEFEDCRPFPLNFILKHYPIRGHTHGQRKVLLERKGRFDPEERDAGFHTHYDGYSQDSLFVWNRRDLIPWSDDRIAELSTLAAPQ